MNKPYKWVISTNKNQRSKKQKIHLFRRFVTGSQIGAIAECGAALSPFIRAGDGEICSRCQHIIESATDKTELKLKDTDVWTNKQIH